MGTTLPRGGHWNAVADGAACLPCGCL